MSDRLTSDLMDLIEAEFARRLSAAEQRIKELESYEPVKNRSAIGCLEVLAANGAHYVDRENALLIERRLQSKIKELEANQIQPGWKLFLLEEARAEASALRQEVERLTSERDQFRELIRRALRMHANVAVCSAFDDIEFEFEKMMTDLNGCEHCGFGESPAPAPKGESGERPKQLWNMRENRAATVGELWGELECLKTGGDLDLTKLEICGTPDALHRLLAELREHWPAMEGWYAVTYPAPATPAAEAAQTKGEQRELLQILCDVDILFGRFTKQLPIDERDRASASQLLEQVRKAQADIAKSLSPAPSQPVEAETDLETIFGVSRKECNEAWAEFCKNHVLPSHLVTLAIHLKACRACRELFDGVLSAPPSAVPAEAGEESERYWCPICKQPCHRSTCANCFQNFDNLLPVLTDEPTPAPPATGERTWEVYKSVMRHGDFILRRPGGAVGQ